MCFLPKDIAENCGDIIEKLQKKYRKNYRESQSPDSLCLYTEGRIWITGSKVKSPNAVCVMMLPALSLVV